MTSTMLIAIAVMLAVGAVFALVGELLKSIKITAYGVAIFGAGVLLFCYDIVALAF